MADRELVVGQGVTLTENEHGIYIHFESLSGHNSSRSLGNNSFTAWYRWASELMDMNAESDKTIAALEFTVKALRQNLSVIEKELSQIDETECGLKVWDRVSLALEFAERD